MSGGNALWPPDQTADSGLAYEIRESLAESSEALFLKEEPIELEFAKAAENGLDCDILESEEQLKELLILHAGDTCVGEHGIPTDPTKIHKSENEQSTVPVGRFFILQPSFGWAELLVTKAAMLSILISFGVCKEFFRYLKAFGAKPFARDEGLGGFDYLETLDDCGVLSRFETCYLIKYVQKRDTAGPEAYPWSLRHSLIYQNIGLNTHTIDHIFIRLSDTMSRRLSYAVGKTPEARKSFLSDWGQVHSLFIESVDGNFRDCINHLDEEVSNLFDRVIMSGIEPGKLREFDTLDQAVRDIKTLQFLADQAERVNQAIETNIDTIEMMKEAVDTMIKSEAQWPAPHSCKTLQKLNYCLVNCRHKHNSNRRSIMAVSTRAKALSQQLRDTVALRNSELARINMEETRLNTTATFDLSEKSGHEAHVLKILTVLALIFAPAGYAADFLQMGYINVADTKFEVTATPGLQLYAIIALPLITTTMIIYGFVEYGKKRMMDRKIAEKASLV